MDACGAVFFCLYGGLPQHEVGILGGIEDEDVFAFLGDVELEGLLPYSRESFGCLACKIDVGGVGHGCHFLSAEVFDADGDGCEIGLVPVAELVSHDVAPRVQGHL